MHSIAIEHLYIPHSPRKSWKFRTGVQSSIIAKNGKKQRLSVWKKPTTIASYMHHSSDTDARKENKNNAQHVAKRIAGNTILLLLKIFSSPSE